MWLVHDGADSAPPAVPRDSQLSPASAGGTMGVIALRPTVIASARAPTRTPRGVSCRQADVVEGAQTPCAKE